MDIWGNAPTFLEINTTLHSDSPCINAGSPAAMTEATDLAGNPRLVNGASTWEPSRCVVTFFHFFCKSRKRPIGGHDIAQIIFTQYDIFHHQTHHTKGILVNANQANDSKSREVLRSMNPKFFALYKWLRIDAIKRYKAFVSSYWQALKEWKRGRRDVLFPAGTYAMRIHSGVNRRPNNRIPADSLDRHVMHPHCALLRLLPLN
ncbi:MAG: hypothetical protein JXR76_31725 [Deltaproteobacteria bacterium]|nr:hypothetical protein [Deltaproteobacteria bacterium]